MQRCVIAMVLALLCVAVAVRGLAETVRCQPNIFGGQDCETPEGGMRSQPNIFGGRDYTLPDGRGVSSQPNIFGGEDYRRGDGGPEAPMVPLPGEPEGLPQRGE